MATIAVIVARGGSVRLPNKALLPFAGTTLIGHKVRTMLACADRVVVGSDSDAILAEAAKHGAEIVRRDAYHCDESRCSANEMIRDMAEKIGGADADVVVWAHPTNPLVKVDTYVRAIAAYQDGLRRGHDSLCSVQRIQRHAWQDGKPFNYDPWAARHTFASELKPLLFQDGAIFIQPRGAMRRNAYFFGRNPVLFEMPRHESVDIDDIDDYRLAESLHSCLR